MEIRCRATACVASIFLSWSALADESPDAEPSPDDPVAEAPRIPAAAERPTRSDDSGLMRLQVIDPYAELRTGPGRGYPVFYAIERGETVDVITRRPGWFEVRAPSGQTGWTTTGELSRTMQASGAPADLPSVSYGDYLKRSWQAGLRSGRFIDGELDGAETFSARGGYKLFSWLDLELEWGRFSGNDIRGTFYGFNSLVEPLSHWRLSPFLSLGVGNMDVDSQPKMVPLDLDSSRFQTYSLGGNYYLGRNFAIEGSYRWFVVDANRSTERLESWSLGFNAFF